MFSSPYCFGYSCIHCSILFWVQRLCQTEESKETVPTRLLSLQVPAASLGVPRTTLTSDLLAANSSFPKPTLRLDNSLERLRTHWKCYTYGYSFIIEKADKLEPPKERDAEAENKNFRDMLPSWHWYMALHRVLASRELTGASMSWVLIGVSLHTNDWLNHWSSG